MMKKNKKNKRLKKAKRIFLDSCKELYVSFLQIPIKIRYVVGIWLLLFLLLVFLIAFTNSNNKKIDSYHEMEEKMNTAMLNYVTEHSIYATNDHYFKMSLDALVRYTSLEQDALYDSSCIGYSIAYYDDWKETEKEEEKYRIQSFIHCDSYTSSNYNDYK